MTSHCPPALALREVPPGFSNLSLLSTSEAVLSQANPYREHQAPSPIALPVPAWVTMSSSVATVLPVGVGYGVVVGVGFFFAFAMVGISMLQNRYTRFNTKTSEEFNTASRNVKPGLIAAGIVSAWTWAATLLQSSTVAYEYGVAGPFWV